MYNYMLENPSWIERICLQSKLCPSSHTISPFLLFLLWTNQKKKKKILQCKKADENSQLRKSLKLFTAEVHAGALDFSFAGSVSTEKSPLVSEIEISDTYLLTKQQTPKLREGLGGLCRGN